MKKTSDERMDLGQYHERHCLRVAVPKRGEFNPAGKANTGCSLTVKQQSQMLQKRHQVRDKNKLLCRSECLQSRKWEFSPGRVRVPVCTSLKPVFAPSVCVNAHSKPSKPVIASHPSICIRVILSLRGTASCHHGRSYVIGQTPGSLKKVISITALMGTF